MLLHLLLRLFIMPRQGWLMLRRIVRYAPEQWGKRQTIRHNCERLREWHRWSQQQPSQQPHTFSQRLRQFWIRQAESDS